MKEEIKKLAEQALQTEIYLYRQVEILDNHMNECSCDDRVAYIFENTLGHLEIHVFCLNCGGYVE